MGALHGGHISLVEQCRQENGVSVCSIFVNPTQFNNAEDLQKYPRTLENDSQMLQSACCDVLFAPSVKEMYPNKNDQKPHYDFGYLDTIMEGKHRKGHFNGVGIVVSRLLDIVEPDTLYLGQKDYQQCMVIKKLIEILGYTHLKLQICETKREDNGLAMSSRNTRLTPSERQKASVIYQILKTIDQNKNTKTVEDCEQWAMDELAKHHDITPEYAQIANAQNLKPITHWHECQQHVVCIAAYVGSVRLIDNLILDQDI